MTEPLSSGAQWARVQEIFDGALRRSGAERRSYLADACGDDQALRTEVVSLLEAHERDGVLGALDGGDRPYPDEIGPYRILGPLGEGGMGVVFLAERTGADFAQRVALKVMRSGFADPRLEDRLRSERRILAGLEHAGIARLIDGGATDAGHPYYAMEHIEGTSFIEYCSARRLTVSQQLRLFLHICYAVQYAHQQLVVHRDLKPSNIMVTTDGRPKLLDFGIAKLLDPADGIEGATRTAPWLSPAYASPEQVRGTQVGTLSDVYSLGVILYEALAGARPYDLEGATPAEMERIVCEQVPERPSQRVDSDRLRRVLHGDLDTIVMKALSKEPGRRYATVGHFAEDIRRFLDRRPVLARPDSFGYRTRKFVERHRTATAAAALAAVSLMGGVLASTWQARRATAERDRATSESEKAALVTGLMVDLFRLSDPTETLGDTVTAREVLDRGVDRIDREFQARPDVQADVFAEVARVYANLGLLPRAERLARRALGMRETVYGASSLPVSASAVQLGGILSTAGRDEEAIALFERAIATREDLVPAPDSLLADAQANLGWLRRSHGAHDRAAELFRSALTAQQALFGETHAITAATRFGLAASEHDRGSFTEAEALFQQALTRYDTTGDRPHPMAANALASVGMLRRLREQFRDSEPLLRSAVQMRRALYDSAHPDVLDAEMQWARSLAELGRYDEALALLTAGLGRASRALGTDHPTAMSMRETIATLLTRLGRYDEAVARHDTAIAQKRARLEPDHPDILFSLLRAVEPHVHTGQYHAADTLLAEVQARLSGNPSVSMLLALTALGRIAMERGQLADATRHLDEAIAIAGDELRPTHRYTLEARRQRGRLAVLVGAPERAIADLEDVLAVERQMRPSPHPRIGRTLLILGDAYLAIGDAQRAEGALRDALDEFAGIPATHWRVGETKSLLGAALRWQGRETEAVDLLVDGLQTIRNHLGPAAAASRRAAALLASAPGER